MSQLVLLSAGHCLRPSMASFESINNTETFLTACANYLCSSNTLALLLVLILSCVLQRQWASAPALTQQQRNVYLLQFRSWVACRNYDTFLCHRLSRSQTHFDIHTLAPHVFIHSFIQRHRHTQLFLAIVFYPRQQNVAPGSESVPNLHAHSLTT